jgi:ketosteroid isomerase-like protein
MAAAVDYESCIRRMWDAFQREGVAGMRPFVDDDVEWRPSDGPPLRGLAALEEYWRATESTRSVVPHASEAHGDCVLVHGSMRRFRHGGFVDTQPSWVYFFRDGRLRRAVAFATRDEALAAIEQDRAGD